MADIELTENMKPEPTIANADLWSKYFRDQWSAWLNPFGLQDANVTQIADGTAARVASFLTLLAAGPIAWLYQANAPAVHEITGDHERASVRPYRSESPEGARA